MLETPCASPHGTQITKEPTFPKTRRRYPAFGTIAKSETSLLIPAYPAGTGHVKSGSKITRHGKNWTKYW